MTVRFARTARGVGVLTSLLLIVGVVAGCADDGPPVIDYVVDARVVGYNANTVQGNAAGTIMTTTRVLPGFSYLGAAGQVTPDRDIGEVTRVPGAVQTLRYEFNAEAVFSDGQTLDCDDLVLAWAAMSGRYRGFTPATRAGYRDIDKVDCVAGERVATVTFAQGRAYRDWLSLFGAGTMLPAHVVARKAGVSDIVGAFRSGDKAAIDRIATAWNSGFDIQPGPIDPVDFPSSGPYRFSEYSVAGGLVLETNDAWWGDAPRVSKIVIHGRETDPARLADGDFDIVDVSAGIIEAELAPRTGGTDSTEVANKAAGRTPPDRALGVEEIVLAGRGVFADVRVRQAFASCVPRDSLAREFGQGSQMWNLRTLAPGNKLAGAVNTEFGQRYGRPDLQRARDALSVAAAEGVAGIDAAEGDRATIRLGYLGPSARWQSMVARIAESCKRVGLEVKDASAPNLSPESLGQSTDALLVSQGADFAASGAANPSRDLFQLHSRDPLNLARYDDPQVTAAINELVVTASDSEQLRLVRVIERAAWVSIPSIPLFAAMRVQRSSPQVANVVVGQARNGTGWNMDRWEVLVK